MRYLKTLAFYEFDSYDEIKKAVDDGENVECECEVTPDGFLANFLVEKVEGIGYVVRHDDEPIEDHELCDFFMTKKVD